MGQACAICCCAGEDCCSWFNFGRRKRKTVFIFGTADGKKRDFVRKLVRQFGGTPDAMPPSESFAVQHFDYNTKLSIEAFNISGATSDERLLWPTYFNIRCQGIVFVIDGRVPDSEIETSVLALLLLLRHDAVIKPRSGDEKKNASIRDTPVLLVILADEPPVPPAAVAPAPGNAPAAAATTAASAAAPTTSSNSFALAVCAKFRIQERIVKAVRNKVAAGMLERKQVLGGVASAAASAAAAAAAASSDHAAASSHNGGAAAGGGTAPAAASTAAAAGAPSSATSTPAKKKLASVALMKAGGSTGGKVVEEKRNVLQNSPGSAEELGGTPNASRPESPSSHSVSAVVTAMQQSAEKHDEARKRDEVASPAAAEPIEDVEMKTVPPRSEAPAAAAAADDDTDQFSASFDGDGNATHHLHLQQFAFCVREVVVRSGAGVEGSFRWLVEHM